MNELNEYQAEAERTMRIVPGAEFAQYATWALGLTGEAGEVAEHVKKYIGHGHPLDVVAIKKELGDVLWYVAALSKLCGFTLRDVAAANSLKLRERYPNGFTSEASLNRGSK